MLGTPMVWMKKKNRKCILFMATWNYEIDDLLFYFSSLNSLTKNGNFN